MYANIFNSDKFILFNLLILISPQKQEISLIFKPNFALFSF